MSSEKVDRVRYLDGLRGLAILLVIGYHVFGRWPQLVPYSDCYAHFTVFRFGWVGVQLFFLLSGFVILMTLEKNPTPWLFLYRRWLRLFPGTLLCSLLIYLTAPLLPERPEGTPHLLDLVPALTFTDPAWWWSWMGLRVKFIEGAYWSLIVEIKFYIFACICFYFGNRHDCSPQRALEQRSRVFLCLSLAYLTSLLTNLLNTFHIHTGFNHFIRELTEILSLNYFGWFSAGSGFYIYYRTSKTRWFACSIGLALLSAETTGGLSYPEGILFACLVVHLFSSSLVSATVQKVLNWRVLQFYGWISYPLYLLHQNIMIALIVKMGYTANLPGYLLPILPLVVVSSICYLIVLRGEPFTRGKIEKALRKFCGSNVKDPQRAEQEQQ